MSRIHEVHFIFDQGNILKRLCKRIFSIRNRIGIDVERPSTAEKWRYDHSHNLFSDGLYELKFSLEDGSRISRDGCLFEVKESDPDRIYVLIRDMGDFGMALKKVSHEMLERYPNKRKGLPLE